MRAAYLRPTARTAYASSAQGRDHPGAAPRVRPARHLNATGPWMDSPCARTSALSACAGTGFLIQRAYRLLFRTTAAARRVSCIREPSCNSYRLTVRRAFPGPDAAAGTQLTLQRRLSGRATCCTFCPASSGPRDVVSLFRWSWRLELPSPLLSFRLHVHCYSGSPVAPCPCPRDHRRVCSSARSTNLCAFAVSVRPKPPLSIARLLFPHARIHCPMAAATKCNRQVAAP